LSAVEDTNEEPISGRRHRGPSYGARGVVALKSVWAAWYSGSYVASNVHTALPTDTPERASDR
jgi:hypothetical protein